MQDIDIIRYRYYECTQRLKSMDAIYTRSHAIFYQWTHNTQTQRMQNIAVHILKIYSNLSYIKVYF